MKKFERLRQEIEYITSHGLGEGEIKIKINTNGEWIIIAERWIRNPTRDKVLAAAQNALDHEFHAVEQFNNGEIILKLRKTVKCSLQKSQ